MVAERRRGSARIAVSSARLRSDPMHTLQRHACFTPLWHAQETAPVDRPTPFSRGLAGARAAASACDASAQDKVDARSATSAARIAFSTSLRALGDEPPLVTPSEEDLRSFLPNLPPSEAIQATAEAVDTNATHSVQTDLVQPAPNRWYTFEIDGLDHTSLCPFWTGSEVQKQFWTGMGFFLASVDRQTGFSTHDIHKRTA